MILRNVGQNPSAYRLYIACKGPAEMPAGGIYQLDQLVQVLVSPHQHGETQPTASRSYISHARISVTGES